MSQFAQPSAVRSSRKSMFTLDDGRNVVVTFVLVSSLFLLWGLI